MPPVGVFYIEWDISAMSQRNPQNTVRASRTQINQSICTRDFSSLPAWRSFGTFAAYGVPREYTDQAAYMLSLIFVFAGRTCFFPKFLAHLNRKLIRWAYCILMVCRPSVVVVRRRPHFQTWISLTPVGQSWLNFMCGITGEGERLHNILGQIGSKLWFPWHQKAPIDL